MTSYPPNYLLCTFYNLLRDSFSLSLSLPSPPLRAAFARPAQRISVMVLSEDGKSMVVFASKDLKKISISSSKGVAGFVVKTGRKLNIADPYDDKRFDSSIDEEFGYKTTSLCCCPIVAGGKVLGVIQACNKVGGFHDKDEIALEALAFSAGNAIRKAQFYEISVRSTRKVGCCRVLFFFFFLQPSFVSYYYSSSSINTISQSY